MMSQLSYVMTLANSIIGVSVLAMPFCFKQCGIVLATLVLLFSSVLSRLACHFLVKSAVMSRRRNFELLAFHAFGHMGKVLVELFIIGFLVGTCIAFFVVMGDVGPQIVGKMIDKSPENIRTSLLVTTSVFIVLPLGLLRNIDSLSSICTATIVFYLCLVLKIIAESMQHIFAGDWYEHVYYWRPSGILQCIPIFSMALFCQTQLFEIYETIPNVSLEKMNKVVRGALNTCTMVYLCVGFFGYIAFCTQPFTGNILMSFEASLSSEMIKMGFVFSIAFSFPLVIFPCRASLNSLLFRRVHTHEPSGNYLPEARFRCLTITIVAISLITGILIPNIEFVLGLVGSTIGVMICLIFPAIFFISISSKHTNERLVAQAILFIGMCIMILSTYANLYALEESSNTKTLATTSKPPSQMNNLPLNLNKDDTHMIAHAVANNLESLANIQEKIDQLPAADIHEKALDVNAKDIRQEPPIPVERIIVTQKPVGTQEPVDNIAGTFRPEVNKIEKVEAVDKGPNKELNTMTKDDNAKVLKSVTSKANGIVDAVKINENEKSVDIQKNDNLINSDAIKKEESELAADPDAANIIAAERHENFKKMLEKHKLEQLQMMQEQKEILKDIREQKQEMEREKQRIANTAQELKESEKRSLVPKYESIPKEDNNDNDQHSLGTNSKKNIVNEVKEKGDKPVVQENHVNKKLKEPTKESSSKDPTRTNILENDIESVGVSKDKYVHKSQIVKKVAEGKSVLIQDEDIVDILNNKVSNKQKVEEPKVRLSNSKELPKGPILNALAKRTSQNTPVDGESVNKNLEILNNDIPNNVVSDLQEKLHSKTDDKNVQEQYNIPIALRMRNQTRLENVSMQIPNKSEENVQVLRRDILENHEREKREVNTVIGETNIKVTRDTQKVESSVRNATVSDDNEKCSGPNKDVQDEHMIISKQGLDYKLPKVDSTEASLIKTNVYLSEQEVANVISVDSNIAGRAEYMKVKQRDLKALDTDENINL